MSYRKALESLKVKRTGAFITERKLKEFDAFACISAQVCPSDDVLVPVYCDDPFDCSAKCSI